MDLEWKRQLRTRSKALFGNSYRLEVFDAVAQLDEPFSPRDVARRLGVADNLVTMQLRQLCDAGLLAPSLAARGIRYERQPSLLWELAPRLVDELSERVSPARAARARRLDPLHVAVEVAHKVMPEIDADAAVLLAAAARDLALSGELRGGLDLDELLSLTRLSRGRMSGLSGPNWQMFVDIALRATLAHTGMPVLYEEISGTPLWVGRWDPRPDAYHQPGRSSSLPLLTLGLTTPEQHLPVAAIPLAIGTADGRRAWASSSSRSAAPERFDLERTAGPSSGVGLSQPSSLREHVVAALEHAARSRDTIARAEDSLGKGAHRGLAEAFPSFLVISSLPYGPPTGPAHSAGEVFPGADPDLVAAVEAARRPALLLSSKGLDEERPHAASQAWISLDDRTRFVLARGTSYRWDPEHRQIARTDHDGTQRWRTVGLSDAELPIAARAIEYHHHVRSRQWLSRWQHDFGPGLVRIRHADRRLGIQSLLILANAAIVASERERKWSASESSAPPQVV